jgi:hypothetical protein
VPDQLTTPDFKSEKQEAAWWDANQDLLLAEFEQAAQDGTIVRGTSSRNLQEDLETVRLETQNARIAREQARKLGLEFHTYVNRIVHDALLQEVAKG